MKKLITIFMAILIFVVAFSTDVSANSAQTYFEGEDRSGVLQIADSPIEVIKEDLTFRINSIPSDFGEYDENYDSTFSAKYTFHNPTSNPVDITLAFPFGFMPDYYYASIDNNKYSLYVNEEKLNYEVRSVYVNRWYFGEDGKTVTDYISGISNSYNETSDVKITKATIKVTSPLDDYQIKYTQNDYEISSTYSYYDYESKLVVYYANSEEYTFDIYFFGDYDTELLSNIKTYKNREYIGNSYWNYKEESLDTLIEIVEVSEITFEDYLLRGYDDTLFNKVDFYNMSLCKYYNLKEYNGNVYNSEPLCKSDYSNILRWYVYDLHFDPEETLTNEVTGPIYPDIDTGYDSTICYFTYLLSPAKTWASFSNLDVYIYTDFHLIKSNRSFEEYGEYYHLHLDNLDDQELTFNICEIENPERTRGRALSIFFIVLAIIAFFGLGLAMTPVVFAVVIFIITLTKKDKNHKSYHYLLFHAILLLVLSSFEIVTGTFVSTYGEPLYCAINISLFTVLLLILAVIDLCIWKKRIAIIRIVGSAIGVTISTLVFLFKFVFNHYYDPTSSFGITIVTILFYFVTLGIGYFIQLHEYENRNNEEIKEDVVEEIESMEEETKDE